MRIGRIWLALVIFAVPLSADEISLSSSSFFTEAGTVGVDFTVNQDGSVVVDNCTPGNCLLSLTGSNGFTQGTIQVLSSGWQLPSGPDCSNFRICIPGLDFPALPEGSTIESATFSFDAGASPQEIFNPNVTFTFEGSLDATAAQLSGCPGVNASAPFPSGNTFSFTPCSTQEQDYFPSFSGGGDFTVVVDVPVEPGEYQAAWNLSATANYTITVDYTTAPEPGTTLSFLAGLGVIGLVVSGRRKLFSA